MIWLMVCATVALRFRRLACSARRDRRSGAVVASQPAPRISGWMIARSRPSLR
ncbi:hypothetical protein PFLmoz3_04015 [Pseudomonas fluorescens]|uniref:Uncharacterized protein n=1 Tax=Pseudomonas fluorescens TaxID=294 RepID=A0A125QI25_PSEFL|nr:hypothetical protein PFLmoz3_04015 [Pseudomonas fluorescens]